MKKCCEQWKTLLCLICFAALLLTGTPAWASDSRVTMSVVDGDVRDVLTGLAAIGRVNVVIDDSVTGRISVNFKNIPFDSALEIITNAKALSMYRTENVIVFSSQEKMEKGFAQVKVFPLKYARADQIKNILVGGGKSDSEFAVENPGAASGLDAGSLKGSITKSTTSSENKEGLKGLIINTDASTNSIIAFGSPAQIEKVRQLLTELDVPYRQIMLECQVMELTKNASKDLGLDWNWANFPLDSATTSALNPFPIAIMKGGDGLTYQMGVSATINALITKGDGKLLARPNVLTFNGNKATIFVGDQLPIITPNVSSSGQTTYTTEYKNAGISLSYVPRINEDEQISASMFIEVSTPKSVTLIVGGQRTSTFQITTRAAQTNVRMHEGDTLVIGGLISNSELKNFNKVPILGDIPIIGAFFQSIHKEKAETEVVMFLKAKIVK